MLKRAIAFIGQPEIKHNKNILMHMGRVPLKELHIFSLNVNIYSWSKKTVIGWKCAVGILHSQSSHTEIALAIS